MGTLVRNGMPVRRNSVVNSDLTNRVGRGSGVVIATGAETEFGVIFSMMQDVCFNFLFHFLATDYYLQGRRTPYTIATQHGRAGEETIDNIVRCYRRHMSDRCITTQVMARYVYDWRYV